MVAIMKDIYLSSSLHAPAGILDTLCPANRARLPRRWQAWLETLSASLRRDAREHLIAAAYEDLPTSLRIDLGVDRRRA